MWFDPMVTWVSLASSQGPEEFVAAAEQLMRCGMSLKWRERADAFLRTLSWDTTWSEMDRLMREHLHPHQESESAFTRPEVVHV